MMTEPTSYHALFRRTLLVVTMGTTTLVAGAKESDEAVAIPWGPYLQNLTPEGVTVMWTASVPNRGVVEYGPGKEQLDKSGKAQHVLEEEKQRQEAVIAGLEPGKTYYYRVTSTPIDGQAPVSSEIGSFVTPVAGATNYTFAVIADTHQSQHAPALAARLLAEQPHFILHAGDYNKTMGGLMRPYREVLRRIPIYFAKGNHDHQHEQWTSMPGPGKDRYYSFRWGNALFLSVDSNDRMRTNIGLTPEGEQYKWIEGELKKSKDTWKFVMQHHPLYSAYDGGMDPALDHLRKLYEEHGVDVVFQGHQHNYDRSHPLRDGKIVSRADGGVIYITASGACGGSEKFPHPGPLWFIARKWRGAPFLGMCAVNDKEASIRFVTAEGSLFDTLELKAR